VKGPEGAAGAGAGAAGAGAAGAGAAAAGAAAAGAAAAGAAAAGAAAAGAEVAGAAVGAAEALVEVEGFGEPEAAVADGASVDPAALLPRALIDVPPGLELVAAPTMPAAQPAPSIMVDTVVTTATAFRFMIPPR
jgi:hypothetical protein